MTAAPCTFESGDPGLEVIVKQNGTVVQGQTTARRLELPPGIYEIELAEGKGSISPSRVVLGRGETVEVSVMKGR